MDPIGLKISFRKWSPFTGQPSFIFEGSGSRHVSPRNDPTGPPDCARVCEITVPRVTWGVERCIYSPIFFAMQGGLKKPVRNGVMASIIVLQRPPFLSYFQG